MSRRYLWLAIGIALFLLLVKLTIGVTTLNSILLTTDLRFENFLLAHRSPLFLHIFNVITLLGNTVVVIGIMLVVGISLFFSRFHNAYVVGLAVTLIGAGGTDFVMKTLIGRARPGDPIRSLIENDSSFPSGHATFSIALYGFLTYFLCKHYPKYSALFVTLGTILILLIGFSRLYLGVHWSSDVIAGFSLGGLWLLIGIEITKRFRDTFSPPAEITHPNSPTSHSIG